MDSCSRDDCLPRFGDGQHGVPSTQRGEDGDLVDIVVVGVVLSVCPFHGCPSCCNYSLIVLVLSHLFLLVLVDQTKFPVP